MKKLFLMSLCACAGFVCVRGQNDKATFSIEGSLKDMVVMPEMVYLSYKTDQYNAMDSARVKNGRYHFAGSFEGVREMTVSTVCLDSRLGRQGMVTSQQLAEFYLEKGKVLIVSTGIMQNAVVTGSEANDEYHRANRRSDLLLDSVKLLIKMGQETMNDVPVGLAWGYGERLTTVVTTDYPAYIRSHRDAVINPVLIQKLMTAMTAAGWLDKMDSLYRLLPDDLRASRDGRELGEKLAVELRTAVGHKAMDFTQQDVEGHPVRLSSFKGRYVLLDFWASTDPGCHNALPVLVKASEIYGSKGLVVLGVSLDDDRASWMKAIEETNSGQIRQVSDLKGMENEAAKMYGISSVPKNLLIDPNGIIIAKNLTSLTLDKTLTSIFE